MLVDSKICRPNKSLISKIIFFTMTTIVSLRTEPESTSHSFIGQIERSVCEQTAGYPLFFTVSKLETRNVDGITNYDRNKQRCFYTKLKTEVSLLILIWCLPFVTTRCVICLDRYFPVKFRFSKSAVCQIRHTCFTRRSTVVNVLYKYYNTYKREQAFQNEKNDHLKLLNDLTFVVQGISRRLVLSSYKIDPLLNSIEEYLDLKLYLERSFETKIEQLTKDGKINIHDERTLLHVKVLVIIDITSEPHHNLKAMIIVASFLAERLRLTSYLHDRPTGRQRDLSLAS
ncbi:hypothetical protein ALC53_05044 [Atta colombica]|uniref:Uncharacterized protein n=1 Tax=Atta colombica TaxID=520822 RepID=A0A151I4J0_9HYME|nr:hypothetical protein ALC53_05044 [Atta colombica]